MWRTENLKNMRSMVLNKNIIFYEAFCYEHENESNSWIRAVLNE